MLYMFLNRNIPIGRKSMSAYVLFENREVHDPELLGQYAEGVAAVVEAFDGRYLAITPECEVVEGEAFVTSPVVIEFPSVERAREWHGSREYAPWKAMRQRAVTNSAVIFEGWAPLHP
jgi:uncharacterized protein (DUF1330 family)